MSNFLLLHGGAYNGWFWYKVKKQLEENSHLVYAPDLPGHIDKINDYSKITFDSYINFVSDFIEKRKKKFILVGHSFSGAIISKVFDVIGSKYIEQLIYVCAVIPQNGKSVSELLKNDKTDLSRSIAIDKENFCIKLFPEKIQRILFNGCSLQDIDKVIHKILPQPLLPMLSPVHLSNNINIERIGIICKKDNALSPEMQEQMYDTINCKKYFLEAGHSPFISHVEQLCKIMTSKEM